jgi:hypothetical protein
MSLCTTICIVLAKKWSPKRASPLWTECRGERVLHVESLPDEIRRVQQRARNAEIKSVGLHVPTRNELEYEQAHAPSALETGAEAEAAPAPVMNSNSNSVVRESCKAPNRISESKKLKIR